MATAAASELAKLKTVEPQREASQPKPPEVVASIDPATSVSTVAEGGKSKPTTTPLTQCDRLAGRLDAIEKGTGILDGSTIDFAHAIPICQADLATHPSEARLMFNLGRAFYSAKNYDGTLNWFRKAADLGNASAMTGIGFLYDAGHGVNQDYAEALNWYRKAADRGDAQKATLLEEAADGTSPPVQSTGKIIWQLVKTPSAQAGQPDIVRLIGNVEIPGRGIALTITVEQNTDPHLQASYLIKLEFKLPPNFDYKSIARVMGFILKSNVNERGDPLSGATAKITNNNFWFALYATESDKAKNIQLLKERTLLDIAFIYENNRHALLTIEKDAAGERAFDDALAAWGDRLSPAYTPEPKTDDRSSDYMVQIGSRRSDGEARHDLQVAQKKYASLGLKGGDVERSFLGSSGTFYRARFAGGTLEQAQALCSKIKAFGGDCVVNKR